MGWEYTDFQRDELYEEVWTEAVSKVAKRYGISDVGLRQICVSLEVPLPPRGYWARLDGSSVHFVVPWMTASTCRCS
jgi:hypothetical protein